MKFQTSDFRFQTCSIAAVVLASAALGAQSRPQPGTTLPLAQIDAQMFHVSAGRRLKPAAWPNGARVAVGLSFDVDNATADLATGKFSQYTMQQVKDAGFLYDSSLMASDDAYEILLDRQPTGVVERR